MLTFTDVTCRRDGKVLFDTASFVIHEGQKVGLTGGNGTGKSSLFNLIVGHLEPDQGQINLQQQVGITHVAQEAEATERSALDYVIDGDHRYRNLQEAIDRCDENQGEELANLHAEFAQIDGYSIHARAGALLNGLGFTGNEHDQPVSGFSGGWRMRLNLAQALISPNELLLLDEPTNHLDLDAVLWLDNWLRHRTGSLILISHDQEFLDSVTSHTLNIESGQVTLFSGNYSAFEQWRAARLASQQALHEKTQARRRELQGFVDRFRAKASKARQAQSRLKMLERLGETQAARIDTPFSFSFRPPEDQPSPLVVLKQAHVGYGDKEVLKNISFSVQSGDRVGLLGANGAGKSTLVKALVGDLPLKRGVRTPAQKLKVGYFAQHQVDQLRSDQSALQAMMHQFPALSESQARSFLGGFGFEGERALQQADTLSGGERARLALALIVQARPNLLLLDEPTNHLDIRMRQALADALVSFEGALLVISHDRTLLRSVVDDLWLVAQGTLTPFDDDLDGYARWLARHRQAMDDGDTSVLSEQGGTSSGQSSTGQCPLEVEKAVDRRQIKRDGAQRRAALAPLSKAVSSKEAALEKLMAELNAVREKLSDENLYLDDQKAELTHLLQEEARVRSSVDLAEESLLESMDALQSAEKQFNN